MIGDSKVEQIAIEMAGGKRSRSSATSGEQSDQTSKGDAGVTDLHLTTPKRNKQKTKADSPKPKRQNYPKQVDP